MTLYDVVGVTQNVDPELVSRNVFSYYFEINLPTALIPVNIYLIVSYQSLERFWCYPYFQHLPVKSKIRRELL